MMYKKDLYAARLIQRWWRLRKIFSKETHDKIRMIGAAKKVQKVWRRKKRLKYLEMNKQKLTQKENKFYKPLSDQKIEEYEEKMKQRFRTFSTAELGEKTPEEIEREFIRKYRGFYDDYLDNEAAVMDTSLSNEIDHMLDFLSADGKVSNLKVWGYDGTTPQFYLQARKLHEKKLETAMNGRLFLHEDDDLDIEGERLLREIREFKTEMVANHFY
mmetsp:Transcript_7030/g.6222  ORF Transcript_7030/g.6222 Transcript_7030/m.6222 type:complete len:215 (+) Transcript_7030:267-911(+)